jgi:hypothetical protein
MKIEFEGQKFELPDDFSQEEVAAALQSAPKPASWWDTVSAIPETTVGMLRQSVGGMLQASAEQPIDPMRRELFRSIGIDPGKLASRSLEASSGSRKGYR